MTGDLDIPSLSSSPHLQQIDQLVKSQAKLITHNNRTAKLWINYIEMVDILRSFIRAERLGDLELHLATLHKMLPWFAAAGHHLYTKSVWLYLQQMLTLKTKFPNVFNIQKNNHVVHSSSEARWNGMECDKAIECNLMKDLKGKTLIKVS